MTFNERVDRQTSTAWGLPTTIDPRTCLVPALPGQDITLSVPSAPLNCHPTLACSMTALRA